MRTPGLLANQFVMQLQQCFISSQAAPLVGTIATSKKFRKKGHDLGMDMLSVSFDMIA